MVALTPTLTNENHLATSRLTAVIDTAADAIVMIDEKGHVQLFNQAAERMFGYDRAEILGQNVSLLMPQSQGNRHPSYITNYLKTGNAKIIGFGRETVALKKDGTLFPIELAVSEVDNANVRTFTGVIRDISERRHVETELLHESVRRQERLGLDLYDGLCQELAGIAFAVRSLEERAGAGQAVDAAALDGVTALLQDAVRHAGELVQGMAPIRSRPDGLFTSLKQLAADSAQELKIKCVFKTTAPVLLKNAIAAACLYRIAQAAIQLAVSRGKADRVEIRLLPKRNSIVLSIADNGEQSSVNRRYPEDILFRIMQYWAKTIGAKVHFDRVNAEKDARLLCEMQSCE